MSTKTKFQSAPLTEARGDLSLPLPDSSLRVSIRSPHRSKGRHGSVSALVPRERVSIRSPHRSKGRRQHDKNILRAVPVSIRSPHRSKGRHQQEDPGEGNWRVSIRSPHRSKGRLGSSRSPARAQPAFQSAPLTEARGDCCPLAAASASVCFNPLPSQKQGETPQTGDRSAGRRGFNPLPSQKQGETLLVAAPTFGRDVSIRSPHRSKGRPVAGQHLVEAPQVSIRSPHRSKGRHDLVRRLGHILPFQSAPLTEARGDGQPRARSTTIGSFNPLPSQKQGETAGVEGLLTDIDVSIRSPHRSKGRPSRRIPARATGAFQSAPLTEARGDSNPCIGKRIGDAFQSAPLTEARGDMSMVAEASTILKFQSAPLTEARGDYAMWIWRLEWQRFNPLPSQKQGETPSRSTDAVCPRGFNPLPSQKQGET